MTTDAHGDAARLARILYDSGALRNPEWHAAVRTVLRHRFVPSYLEQRPDGSWRTVRGDDESTRQEWLAAVYSDRALTTAVRDDGAGNDVAISSSSQPGLMVRMLEALELHDEHRVLEIGTGTGYNAGLLCHRLGDSQVASVDVESAFVAEAAMRLRECGFTPTLAVADGADGLPDSGPYDRIIATCSVPRIPAAWLAQVRRHGRVLTDIKITGAAGSLVDLRTTTFGAAGSFLPKWAGFMPLRPKVPPPAGADRQAQAVERTTTTPSATPWWDHQLVWFLAALSLPPGVVTGFRLDPERRTPTAATCQAADGAWVEIDIAAREDGTRLVRASDSDLWRTVEDAYALWWRLGEPGWDRFGLTVDAGTSEQHVWFDRPGGSHTWTLPDGAGASAFPRA